ncbi:MAG: hypothetical protein PW843_01200 [Azospirillaceae bacterium]|nr:hypothetical protein [Azospirillaceae bacterium]
MIFSYIKMILYGAIISSILACPTGSAMAGICKKFAAENDRGKIPGVITIDAARFNDVMWNWYLAKISYDRKNYKSANQDLIRALAILGRCTNFKRPTNDDSGYVEIEADQYEIRGNAKAAARIRIGLLEGYFADCMDQFLDIGE